MRSPARIVWWLGGAALILSAAGVGTSSAGTVSRGSAVDVTRLLILDRPVEARAAPDARARIVDLRRMLRRAGIVPAG